MRIAFDHQIFSWQEYGGVSRYICRLAQGFAASHDNDVHIVAPLYVNRYLAHTARPVKIWGIPTPYIPRTRRMLRATNALLARPALNYLSPDIVHETYYSIRGIAPAVSKIVLTVHDMIHERFPEFFSAKDPTQLEKQAAVQRADHVICVSKQTQSDLIEFLGIAPEKTSVVHHGFALTTIQESPPIEAVDRPYLLYVGHRAGYKNYESLLRAVAASSALRRNFSIVCFGGGAFNRREIALANDLGLPEMSMRHVAGSDTLLAQLYRGAEAFIYPSRYEGFGIPPLEAMSFDCPVACSNSSSIPEVVGNAGAYFDPNDVDSMRTTIENLVLSQSLRKQLVDAGRERLNAFSWARCSEESLNIYNRLLGN